MEHSDEEGTAAFVFRDPGPLVDDDLELVLIDRYPGDADRRLVPAYRFKMARTSDRASMGSIELRVGHTDHLVLYAGQIGYRVFPDYRGHHYAARSCRLLFPLARAHGLNTIWITVNPDNAASRRTCEILGAELVEIVDLPENTDMYRQGDRQKCRYRLNL